MGGTQTKLAVASITSTRIQATVMGNTFANAGSTSAAASVTVFNPPSPPPAGCITSCNGGGGGGSSAPPTFTIFAARQSSFAPAAAAKTPRTATGAGAAETPAPSLDRPFVSYTPVQNHHHPIF